MDRPGRLDGPSKGFPGSGFQPRQVCISIPLKSIYLAASSAGRTVAVPRSRRRGFYLSSPKTPNSGTSVPPRAATHHRIECHRILAAALPVPRGCAATCPRLERWLRRRECAPCSAEGEVGQVSSRCWLSCCRSAASCTSQLLWDCAALCRHLLLRLDLSILNLSADLGRDISTPTFSSDPC